MSFPIARFVENDKKKNCSKNAWKMFAIMGKGKIKEAIPNITARRMVKNG